MKLSPLLLLGAGITSAAVSPDRRALPNAPNEYAPANVSCPVVKPRVRTASKLSPNETEWLESRRKEIVSPLKDLLGRLNLTNFDAPAYIDRVSKNTSNLPNIGIAVSGGGYRAMLNGAGALKAGGGWLVGSVYINNFTTIGDLQASEKTWDLSNNILEGPNVKHLQLLNTIDYWTNLVEAVHTKKKAGFETSLTDYWGRALSYQFINASDGGIDYTWSSIASMRNFQEGRIPLPFLVADGRNPGELIIGANSTVYEVNPWEFGTFDPAIYSFAPLEYLGSDFKGGNIHGSCVRGLDNAGYIMGTSSSLFNQGLLRLNKTKIPKIFKSATEHILTDLGEDNKDIANYPNPFYQNSATTPAIANRSHLSIVDGGEDGQNIPLHPLIQPERHVDVIFAVDSTSNIHSWPSGKSLVRTYERSLNSTGVGNGTVFPAVPDPNTFINLGLNKRPTFFGCDSKNMTGPAQLVVYLPNAPYTHLSNTSTFDLSYSAEDRDAMITNGYNVATRANGTEDASWSSCVGCAILSRSAERTGTTLPDICTECFKSYCWNGTIDSSEPTYEPELMVKTSSGYRDQQSYVGLILSAVISLGLML
ncbi:Lysophospholipase 1 [Aspergillus melleus]|uniref:Lysophospholipase 1 n=1 Tax=Aspergillus melleus TaxID=138277 RepID=UPI001E8EB6A6|nr:Lysophospholipase 1 [Aspergillus melleus]KAH8425270.1 Lysophospholipase 1 [Aspergillus melleus]